MMMEVSEVMVRMLLTMMEMCFKVAVGTYVCGCTNKLMHCMHVKEPSIASCACKRVARALLT